jgi:hypothetical protein
LKIQAVAKRPPPIPEAKFSRFDDYSHKPNFRLHCNIFRETATTLATGPTAHKKKAAHVEKAVNRSAVASRLGNKLEKARGFAKMVLAPAACSSRLP